MIVMQEVMNELGLYVVSFDRAGYGQSDPNPKRSIQSDAEDVVDLADRLGLRPKFFVIATSYGGYTGWGLLKYRPERLAGVAFSAPGVNFWWPGFSKAEMTKAWGSLETGDKLSLTVAHHLPSLTYWFNTQEWFPKTTIESKDGFLHYHEKDQELIKTVLSSDAFAEVYPDSITGSYESLLCLLKVFLFHFLRGRSFVVEKTSTAFSNMVSSAAAENRLCVIGEAFSGANSVRYVLICAALQGGNTARRI